MALIAFDFCSKTALVAQEPLQGSDDNLGFFLVCLEVIHEAYGILAFALEIGIGESVGTRVPEVMPLLAGRLYLSAHLWC